MKNIILSKQVKKEEKLLESIANIIMLVEVAQIISFVNRILKYK